MKVPMIIVGLLVLACLAALFVSQQFSTPTATEETGPPVATETEDKVATERTEVIGTSVEGREITRHSFGTGDTELLFVGGVHGGYEWNSSLLAWRMIEFFTLNPDEVPNTLAISIIPSLNPDGLAAVVGTGGKFSEADVPAPSERVAAARFNANGVDLNRNFDCKWQPTSTWRGSEVSAGNAPFSEPEAAALRDTVLATQPDAVVFWHSQANNVYASECHDGVLSDTLSLMNTYADAGNYGAVPSFDAYPITGDAEGWLASIGIPAVTVELESYQDIEWNRNYEGVMAVIESYDAMAK